MSHAQVDADRRRVVTVREGVHVPSESVPLIKDVTCDMARGDVNTSEQCSKLHAVLEPFGL